MTDSLAHAQTIKPVFWYMLNQKLVDITKNKVLTHIVVWVFFAGIFFLGISGVERLPKALGIIMAVFAPSIPAVYLHFFAFDKWFRSKAYIPYLIALAAIAWLFGWLIELISIELVFADEPDTFVSGKLALVSFLVVSTGFRSFFEGIQAKNKLNEIEAKQAIAELESLKSQVNPHFLFNSLNNIYGLLMEDKDRAGDSLLTLSSLLRYLIYASQKASISLEEEVQFLDDYMAMERLRLGEKCQLKFEKTGDFTGHSLSPFLLIPFVENAFKHGSFATVNESYILVKLEVQNQTLLFSVKNSIKKEPKPKNGGTGIANVRRRLELLLPDKHELTVNPEKDEFVVKLKLEL